MRFCYPSRPDIPALDGFSIDGVGQRLEGGMREFAGGIEPADLLDRQHARQKLGDVLPDQELFVGEAEIVEAQSNTTTPRAMALTMQKLLLGNALSPASRQQLQQWLVANTTGDKRLRAGLPSGWRVGDKTGTNRTDANDIGIAWPTNGRAPLLITAYLAESTASSAVKEATLASVARLAASLVGVLCLLLAHGLFYLAKAGSTVALDAFVNLGNFRGTVILISLVEGVMAIMLLAMSINGH